MERKGAALCRIFKTKTKVPEMLIEIREDLYLDCKQNKFLSNIRKKTVWK